MCNSNVRKRKRCRFEVTTINQAINLSLSTGLRADCPGPQRLGKLPDGCRLRTRLHYQGLNRGCRRAQSGVFGHQALLPLLNFPIHIPHFLVTLAIRWFRFSSSTVSSVSFISPSTRATWKRLASLFLAVNYDPNLARECCC